MIRQLFTFLALGMAINAAQTCLECICKLESQCKPNIGCNKDEGSLSCGPYQIKLPYYLDCHQPGKEKGMTTEQGWKKCGNDKTCSETCVKAYYARYKSLCAETGLKDCEIFARNHNGGPYGCKNRGKTDEYWRRIKVRGCSPSSKLW